MNMNDVFFDFVVKFKGVLPRKGLGLGEEQIEFIYSLTGTPASLMACFVC